MARGIRFFVLFLLVFMLAPGRIEAASIGGECGSNLTWELTDEGVLKVEGEGRIPDYTYILHYNGNLYDAPWADYIDRIQKVVVGDGVTYIGNQAFAGCENLVNVTLPDTLTGLGYNVFENCMNLKEVQVPEGVKDLGMAFCYCQGLTKIRIPDTQTKIADFAFKNCLSLEEVIVGNQITSIGEDAFYQCISLKEFTLSGKVKTIGRYAFAYCKNLTDIYYGGDEETRQQMEIKGGNDYLLGAKWHYKFQDVKAGEYYYDAVMWAVRNGITTGTSPTVFSPNGVCTRAEMVTFLWREAGCPEAQDKKSPFLDVCSEDYFYDAVLWAYANNITTGVSVDHFAPNAQCTRGQMITFMWRTAGKPKCSEDKNPFIDVDNVDYFYEAVLWALEQGITTGTSEKTFSPNEMCLRSQAVTFLYRNNKDEVKKYE